MPRQIAMFLMREETDVSLLRIGAELGGRDHSTVLHACDKITRESPSTTSSGARSPRFGSSSTPTRRVAPTRRGRGRHPVPTARLVAPTRRTPRG